MTFFKVNDPKNRDLIKEVIAKRSIIREADRRRKMGEAFEYEQLSRFFKPITQQVEKTTEKIEKGVKGLPGEIARILPQPINIQMPQQQPQPQQQPRRRRQQSPPPLQERQQPQPQQQPRRRRQQSPPPLQERQQPQPQETYYGEKEVIKDLPSYVTYKKGVYNFNDYFKFNLDPNSEVFIDISNNKKYNLTNKIYDILTNENSKLKWEDLNDYEKNIISDILLQSKSLYSNYERSIEKNYILPNKNLNKEKWDNIYSHIWFNRFYYMNDEMFEKESKKAKSILKKPNIKTTQETKEKIKQRLSKGEGLKGSGLKKNYVTLPSDPSELVDRLTLLSGSKDAGNTGVYNEMVSICDELLKRKIIGKGQYKQFLSNI